MRKKTFVLACMFGSVVVLGGCGESSDSGDDEVSIDASWIEDAHINARIDADTTGASCESRECGPDPAGSCSFCGGCEGGSGCDGVGECGAWPPHIDSLYSYCGGCQRPQCDREADPGYDFDTGAEQGWMKEMNTYYSDCPQLVGAFDPRAKLGATNFEYTGVPTTGSCVYDGQLGTAHEGVIAWCGSWNAGFGDVMINYHAVIDHMHESPARGIGKIHVTNLPEITKVKECFVEMEVTYRKCPEQAQCPDDRTPTRGPYGPPESVIPGPDIPGPGTGTLLGPGTGTLLRLFRARGRGRC